MDVLILDDDKDFILRLKEKLEIRLSEISDNTSYHVYLNPNEMILENKFYDLAFLDIDLFEESGIQVARRMRNLGLCKNIVFVSAHAQLIHQSLTVHPFFFLRKHEFDKDFEVLMELLKEAFKSHKLVQVVSFGESNVVSLDNILYVAIESKMLSVHTLQGKVFNDYRPLKAFVEMLGEDNFIQINQSYVINVDYMLSYNYEEVLLVGDIHLGIGRTFKKTFPKAYQNYIVK